MPRAWIGLAMAVVVVAMGGCTAAPVRTDGSGLPERVDTASAATSPAVAAPAEPVDSNQRIKDFLASLSDSEKDELMRELGRERAARWVERMKYQLPTDQRLATLQWANKGANRLSDVQKARIAELAEAMKPRIDAGLQGSWKQHEQLMQQMGEASVTRDRAAIEQIRQQLGDVQTRMSDARKQLDGEYKERLRSVLMPEQMALVEGEP